jgi:hypothetical protein
VLAPAFRGVPSLNVDRLSVEQARAIVAADGSGGISAAANQPTVLFVDLGRYCYSPALAELADDQGRPLLRFGAHWAAPAVERADLVVPLGAAQSAVPKSEGNETEQGPATEAEPDEPAAPANDAPEPDAPGGDSQ